MLNNSLQWRIQDFPEGVRQLKKRYYFANFLSETAWKYKNLDPGRRPWRPPWIRQWFGFSLERNMNFI